MAVDPAIAAAVDGAVSRACRGTGLGTPGATLGPGQERDQDSGVLIPQVQGLLPSRGPMSMALLLDARGRVLCSSYPGRYQPGSDMGPKLPQGWEKGIGAVLKTADGKVAWASQMILWRAPTRSGTPASVAGKGVGKGGIDQVPLLGYVYVQAPVPAGGLSWTDLKPLLQSGLVLLLVTIPVGVVFGMLTTRGVVQRLRRLAAGTVGFAAGDFSQRVPEAAADEVGQLERHFNRMAERLATSIDEQRTLAEQNARLAERSRISRELHDSISQDLFSISTLVGGLRKALPEDSPVQPQLATLTETVGSTIQEMRALLLELRPTALEEKGLLPALADLCEAYEARVGVHVDRELVPVTLEPAVEQAVFRIAQEGLSNAVRHSEAGRIEVRLRPAGEQAELTVEDNGQGFDRATTSGHGLGLRLMAERIREVGGSLVIDSEPGRGTSLRVLLPAG
jgi:signal transduction histidine kinase